MGQEVMLRVVGPWRASVEAAAVQKALLDFFGASWTARGSLIRGLVTSERQPECAKESSSTPVPWK